MMHPSIREYAKFLREEVEDQDTPVGADLDGSDSPEEIRAFSIERTDTKHLLHTPGLPFPP
jgi:hypothetical protein